MNAAIEIFLLNVWEVVREAKAEISTLRSGMFWTDLSVVEAALVKYFREQKIKAHIGLCFRTQRGVMRNYFNVYTYSSSRKFTIHSARTIAVDSSK
jgi:hypothetical protein